MTKTHSRKQINKLGFFRLYTTESQTYEVKNLINKVYISHLLMQIFVAIYLMGHK
jgi:hypothetical protein